MTLITRNVFITVTLKGTLFTSSWCLGPDQTVLDHTPGQTSGLSYHIYSLHWNYEQTRGELGHWYIQSVLELVLILENTQYHRHCIEENSQQQCIQIFVLPDCIHI